MSILNTILESGLDENILATLSDKSGIDTNGVQSLITELTPRLLNGAKENLAGDSDSSDLIKMISNTDLDKIKEEPSKIDTLDNENMLAQLFSSLNENEKDVADELSVKRGFDASSISSLLPMIAPLIMGALNKQTNLNSKDTSNTNDITCMLTDFIDQDDDGSVVDDLMGMAKKFF
ncbi:MAG: hypothetical protein C0625_13670 [Arcobacter sp.]|nr:MAG: hypothetical protein C0625_13670 [Arcobacter sp.]